MSPKDNQVDEAQEVQNEGGENEEGSLSVKQLLGMKDKTLQERLALQTEKQFQTATAINVTDKLVEAFRGEDLEVKDLGYWARSGFFATTVKWTVEGSRFDLPLTVMVGKESRFKLLDLEKRGGEDPNRRENFELIVCYVLREYEGLTVRSAFDPDEEPCGDGSSTVYLQGILEVDGLPVRVEHSYGYNPDDKRIVS